MVISGISNLTQNTSYICVLVFQPVHCFQYLSKNYHQFYENGHLTLIREKNKVLLLFLSKTNSIFT